MQVETFKVFRDLVETQSFSKAADLSFITQSAVSQQIRGLEERFHTPLIERSSKRFALTREGQLLYDTSKEIIYAYDTLQNQIAEMRNVISGTIRLATVYSIGLHELPPYLKVFIKEYPNVNVHVEYRRSNQVYEDVLDGTRDLGLVAFPIQKKNLKIEPFRKDRLILICHPQNPFASHGTIALEEIPKAKFIGFEPDIPTRKAIDKIFKEAGIELRPVMEFDNIETVKRAVEIDAGVSIVPRATVQQEIKNGTLIALEFKGVTIHRPLGIIYRNGRVLSPGVIRFIKTLHEHPEHIRDEPAPEPPKASP